VEKIPQDQPVAAFEVGIGAGLFSGFECVQIRARRSFGIEVGPGLSGFGDLQGRLSDSQGAETQQEQEGVPEHSHSLTNLKLFYPRRAALTRWTGAAEGA